MGGFSNAFWLWFPVLIYRVISAFFRTVWKFNLWCLQTVSGVPLYYCRPEYRLAGIFLGTLGIAFILSLGIFLLMAFTTPEIRLSHRDPLTNEVLLGGVLGVGLLVLCRLLIRRGSI